MTKRTVKTWIPFSGSYFYDEGAVKARTRKEAIRKWVRQQKAAGRQYSASEAAALVVFWVNDPKGTDRTVYTSYPAHRQ